MAYQFHLCFVLLYGFLSNENLRKCTCIVFVTTHDLYQTKFILRTCINIHKYVNVLHVTMLYLAKRIVKENQVIFGPLAFVI